MNKILYRKAVYIAHRYFWAADCPSIEKRIERYISTDPKNLNVKVRTVADLVALICWKATLQDYEYFNYYALTVTGPAGDNYAMTYGFKIFKGSVPDTERICKKLGITLSPSDKCTITLLGTTHNIKEIR